MKLRLRLRICNGFVRRAMNFPKKWVVLREDDVDEVRIFPRN